MRRRLRDGRDGRALCEELERIGEALPPDGARSRWFLELGVACEMLVPERQRALQLYARAVELDPTNGEAIDRARMVCLELGQLDEFAQLTQIELDHETDDERREHLTALIGEALLNRGDRQRAAAFLVGAAGQFPASLAIQDALGTISYDDDWRAELERLIDIGLDADAENGARVSLRAARILRMEAPEDAQYERLLQRVLDYDPYDESAHLLLDVFYAAAGRWDELEALQDRLVLAFPGSDEQAALCQRFSCSWIARGQHDRAADWCWRAIELGRLVYPIAALTMLRGIYAARRDWDRLLEAIDALLATPLDDDADVHTALLGGTIAWKAKRDLTRAAHYFDRVRRVAVDSLLVIDFDDYIADQRNPEVIGDEQRALMEAARQAGKAGLTDRVIDAWKRAISADPTKRAPRRALARVLYRTERWRTLADALRDEEAHACSDDGERIALLFQLAALYRDRLRQDVLATATLQRIVELSPGNLAALDQLAGAFEEMRRWPDAVATLTRKLGHVEDPVERGHLFERIAEIWQDRLGNEAEAVKALEGAFALDRARGDLAQRLERVYGKRREWDKLFALKQQLAATLERADEQLAAQLELAQLAGDKLKKPALAIAAWSAVLALEPRHEAALAALERLYAASDAHAQLAEIYARRAEEPSDGAVRLTYLTRLGQLYMSELPDPARAIGSWQAVLRLAPGHGRALEMLRRLYLAEKAWDPLQALFADERRLDECARLFERHATEVEGAAQVELWLRAARLWRDAVGRRELAQRAFERALALDEHHGEAIDALAALYAEVGDSKKLAGVLALQLDHSPDAATKKARLLALAELHGRELRDAAGAFRWQLAAFEIDPLDGELRRELERLAARTNSWAVVIERYEATCAARADVDRVALLSVAAAERERALGDVDGALAAWQRLAALEPAVPAAIDALVRLYEARQAWRELHDIYAHKLALVGNDADARRPIVIAMAALAERQGDDARAMSAYRRLIEELGPDDVTLEALERLYERAGALAEVEGVLTERLALPANRAKRSALTFRLAETRRRRDRIAEAIVLLGEVLEAQPNHEGARAALEAITTGPTHRLEAALLLEPILRARGAMAQLVDVLRIRVEHAQSADAVALLHELAWIEQTELGRRQDAFATLASALRREPSHQPTYDALEKMMSGEGDGELLAALYKEVAAQPLSIPEHVEVRGRLGALYRDRLGAPERALATFSRVLDLQPDNEAADGAVDGLLALLGRHRELAERLQLALERRPAGPGAQARALRLAALYERDLGDGAAALAAYATILDGDGTCAAALAGLERLFAAGVERQRVAALLMPHYRARGRAQDLVRVWAAALVEAPTGQPIDELLQLAREAGQLETLRATLVAAQPAHPSLRLALAEVERARGDDRAAEAILRQLLDGDGEELAVLRALDALLAARPRPADRIATLTRRAALEEPALRVGLLLTLAELQAGAAIGDVAAARATLEGALALGDDPRVLRALGAAGRRRGGDRTVAAAVRGGARGRRGAGHAGGALRAPRALARAGRGARAAAVRRGRRRGARRAAGAGLDPAGRGRARRGGVAAAGDAAARGDRPAARAGAHLERRRALAGAGRGARAVGRARQGQRGDGGTAGASRDRRARAARARHRRLAGRARHRPAQRRGAGRAGRAVGAQRPPRRATARARPTRRAGAGGAAQRRSRARRRSGGGRRRRRRRHRGGAGVPVRSWTSSRRTRQPTSTWRRTIASAPIGRRWRRCCGCSPAIAPPPGAPSCWRRSAPSRRSSWATAPPPSPRCSRRSRPTDASTPAATTCAASPARSTAGRCWRRRCSAAPPPPRPASAVTPTSSSAACSRRQRRSRPRSRPTGRCSPSSPATQPRSSGSSASTARAGSRRCSTCWRAAPSWPPIATSSWRSIASWQPKRSASSAGRAPSKRTGGWPSSIARGSSAGSSFIAPASSAATSWPRSTRRSAASNRPPTATPPKGSIRLRSWPKR